MKRLAARSGSAIALAAVLVLPGIAAAHSYTLGKIAIGHVWAKPAERGGATSVYGPIFDQDIGSVTLEAVSTPAGRAGFRSETAGKLDHIDVPAGKPLALAAWREHIWVDDLARSLKPGDHFPLTMDFGAAGQITVEVEVENQGTE